MEKQFKKNITWVIKNGPYFPFHVDKYSDVFVVGGCKWRFFTHRGFTCGKLCLEVADYESLHVGWRRHVRYASSVVKRDSVESLTTYGTEHWFDNNSCQALLSVFYLKDIFAKDGGFLINGELKIVVEVEVLEVVGKLDVTEETSTIMETMDVNGFQLLSSQVGFVSHIFERHPEIASEFRSENPNLRAGFMSLLLSLIDTLRHSPQELHKDDLAVAYVALGSMKEAGFKLDWLEKKLDEMSEKKEKEEAGETRMQEIENELKHLKHKCSDLEAELEKEKLEVLAAKAPLSFDDII